MDLDLTKLKCPGLLRAIESLSGSTFEEYAKRLEMITTMRERKRARKEHSQKMEVKREGNAFSIKPKGENN